MLVGLSVRLHEDGVPLFRPPLPGSALAGASLPPVVLQLLLPQVEPSLLPAPQPLPAALASLLPPASPAGLLALLRHLRLAAGGGLPPPPLRHDPSALPALARFLADHEEEGGAGLRLGLPIDLQLPEAEEDGGSSATVPRCVLDTGRQEGRKAGPLTVKPA